MSTRTTMCLVNLSGQDITEIKVTQTSGFENAQRDPAFLQGQPVATYRSLCSYVELDSMTPTYTVSLTFADGSAISFTDNQGHPWDTKFAGPISYNGQQDLVVWRTLGGNVSGTAGTNAIYIRPLQAPDNSTWMGDLLTRKPNVRLSELTMPGSHDAGMWTGCSDDAKTQDLSILGQLKAGSRYFDIRTCMYQGEVWTYHGPAAWGDKLTNILSDVLTFLAGVGVNETVILKFSHAYANSRQPTVNQVLSFPANHLYTSAFPNTATVNPGTQLLADLKGMLVAVFASDDASFEYLWSSVHGIIPYHDIDATAPLPIPVAPDGLTVYDNYSDDGTHEKMVADQNPKLAKYGGWGKEYLFLLSWNLTGGGWVSDISVLASMANPWLPRKIGEFAALAEPGPESSISTLSIPISAKPSRT